MKFQQIPQLILRFVEFYRFSHRVFIYDDPITNQNAWDQVEQHPYWRDKKSFHQAIATLNSGDCMVIALAVGEVLRLNGWNVTYHANGGHYYFSVKRFTKDRSLAYIYIGSDDVRDKGRLSRPTYFDAIHFEGTRTESDMLQPKHPSMVVLRQGDAEWLVECCMSHDILGKEHVEQFVRFYHPDYVYPYKIDENLTDYIYS